jgi:hypothetical protein
MSEGAACPSPPPVQPAPASPVVVVAAVPPARPAPGGWLVSLFSNQNGAGDAVVICGIGFSFGGLIFEAVNVIGYGRPFDMIAFGAMCAQLLVGIGGGIGGRDWLASRGGGPPPGPWQPPGS